MSAVWTKALADLRRRRLQSIVIFVVVLLSSAAATLALDLLVATDAPYDHAFSAAHGAHLSLTFAGDAVTADQLRATASAQHVSAAAGPWPLTLGTVVLDGGNPPPKDKSAPPGAKPLARGFPVAFVGREQWDTAVDRLTIESGRWLQQPSEVVLSQRKADELSAHVGTSLTVDGADGPVTLTVVGIAASISPESGDAWVLPQQIPALAAAGGRIDQQMLYRVSPAGTADDLRAASQSIVAGMPANAVLGSANYLDAKRDADLTTAIMLPFLVAFSIVGLVIAALIIANVGSGAVTAGYRELGILKALGMTPAQVVLVLMLQVLIPALAGCCIGIPLGTMLSQPFLRDTAHALGVPAAFQAVTPVIAGVLVGVLAIAATAAFLAAWRAGRLSAIAALTLAGAPSRRGGRMSRLASRLPLPRAIGLGLGDTFASPLRALTTTGAIMLGVCVVVFALGLNLSLGRVATALVRNDAVQVTVRRPDDASVTDQQMTALIQQNPSTAAFTAETSLDISIPGIAEPIRYYAYRGDASWTGYELISGRWFSGPGEVVAPTKLIHQAHLRLGDHIAGQVDGQPVSLTLVGEIFDSDDGSLLLRGDWSTIAAAAPGLQPSFYEIQLQRGVDPEGYAAQLQQGSGTLDVSTTERDSSNTTLTLLQSVITGLAIVLTIIAAIGVFNTVVLGTRERAREIAILKAIGMQPGQVVAMVVGSVMLLGVLAGLAGIPLGLLLHRRILQLMGQIANGTGIPEHIYAVFAPATLALLLLTGVLLAVLGAFIPARWAASGPAAARLQAE